MLIAMIGIMGACMFYADGMITPAISVLSAIEGIEIALPGFHNFVIPITLIIIFFLFWFQSKGTASVGFFIWPCDAGLVLYPRSFGNHQYHK